MKRRGRLYINKCEEYNISTINLVSCSRVMGGRSLFESAVLL